MDTIESVMGMIAPEAFEEEELAKMGSMDNEDYKEKYEQACVRIGELEHERDELVESNRQLEDRLNDELEYRRKLNY